MSQFGACRRVAFVVAGISNDICLSRTGVDLNAGGVVQVFLALNEPVVAVKRACHVVNRDFVKDFCHTGKVLIYIVIRMLLRRYEVVVF